MRRSDNQCEAKKEEEEDELATTATREDKRAAAAPAASTSAATAAKDKERLKFRQRQAKGALRLCSLSLCRSLTHSTTAVRSSD